MGQKVTIGGNRVGSGKKMQAELHNYYRSTHNLSEKWASTAASGVLYPSLVKVGMRGDVFEINLEADLRTIPTQGPLFGSFKMQTDVYQIPVRLYQGILHNNPLAIGLQMNQVIFPKIELRDYGSSFAKKNGEMNASSLMKYLGFSGMGTPFSDSLENLHLRREINALPILSYYDIVKTYYANKQEEVGYFIGVEVGTVNTAPVLQTSYAIIYYDGIGQKTLTAQVGRPVEISSVKKNALLQIRGEKMTYQNVVIQFNETNMTIQDAIDANFLVESNTMPNDTTIFNLILTNDAYNKFKNANGIYNIQISADESYLVKKCACIPFDLSNIDRMRYELLSSNQLGSSYHITVQNAYYPYKTLVESDQYGKAKNAYPMNGLCLKTYQNDLFNNWLNTEWIEGENGINELTKLDTSDGITIDALSLAEKLYNMLNRIAVAGNTYEDWQDVVYEEVKRKQIESPIFCGGMSQEVVFDEIVQSTPSKIDGEISTLGTLGGRGRLSGSKKGGHLTIKCDEACIIMAITSLTPRQFYTQGNEFYFTELETMDDFHKPAMDGIGFQDLIGERLAWWDTKLDALGHVRYRSKIGKLPAWMEYMTSVDKAYGEFCDVEKQGFMILNRNYERTDDNLIKDATTYVDPSKYNYAFAYQALDAQNFWIQLNWQIKARRLMSARLIPNV